MAKKKKKTTDPTEKLPNGMYKERTGQALLQGGLLLVFLCGLGVFSYIVSMIPAGIFGVAITKDNTTNQTVYDIQNLVLTAVGVAICTVGGWMLSKKTGEADAQYAFQNRQERAMDKRYILLSVCVAVVLYFVIAGVIGFSFFAGPIRYLGIFLSRAERRINEGIKVPMLIRMAAAAICLAVQTPLVVKGAFTGFRARMAELEDEEARNLEQQRRAKEAEEAEKAAKEAERAEREARRAERDNAVKD